jgi:hypothetical protein
VGADAGAVNVQRENTVLLQQVLVYRDYLDTTRRFRSLTEQWRQTSRWLSSVHAMVANPAYLQIVGMGSPVVPLILEELQRRPDHWFPALGAITGENPVNEADAGNIRRMTAAWLEWGRSRGLVR